MYFALSGLCLFVGTALSAYYMILRDRTLAEITPLLQGGLLFAALFWVIGMLIARRQRKLASAINGAFGSRGS
jgi:hypothetical protein